jgi:hypothetical protein
LAARLLPLSIEGMAATSSLVLRWAGPGVRAVAGRGRACAGCNRNSGRKRGQLGPALACYLSGVNVCLELTSVGGIAIVGRRGRVNRPRLLEALAARRREAEGARACSHIVTGVRGTERNRPATGGP